MSELSAYLDVLDLRDDEFVSLFWKCADEQHYAVLPPAAVEYTVGRIPPGYDAWLAPNPTAGPARIDSGGRGTMTDVTRASAVFADIDVKEGACPDFTAAAQLVTELSGLLGVRPMCIVRSGGGLQPIWRLDDCSPDTGARLLRRFGRFVKQVAKARNINADSVFDTARVLRIPGTLNHKYSPPRPASLLVCDGAPMTASELDDRLNEVGIYELGDDEQTSGEVVSDPADWRGAAQTCGYAYTLMQRWADPAEEPVGARHPWLLCKFVRLECAWRNKCLTEADYTRAEKIIIDRFRAECARPGDARKIPRMEIADIREEARERASRKTETQLWAELGKASGVGHVHLMQEGMSTKVVEPQQVSAPPLEMAQPVPGVIEAEDNFWDSRDSLKEIYDFALSRMCSPWAVLGACAAMALAWVRPNTTLPSLVGGRAGSLNLYVAIAAGSGQGKSSAIGAADRLLPVKPFRTGVGSGEGMMESFVMRSTEGQEKRVGTRESVLIEIDEFDLLQTMSARTGSSLISLLKTGFTGGRLALTYANKKYPVLEENTYRIAMIAAVQPGKAGWIFNDAAGGFPQRFLWFPGNDGRISRECYREISYTMGLNLPAPTEFTYPREILVPEETRDYILDNRVSAGRGDADAGLNSHAAFTRLKFAYALTVLDGRFSAVTDEDWALSGTAAKVSDITRDWVRCGIRAEREREATEIGERQGTVRAVAEETRDVHAARRGEAVMVKVAARIREAGEMSDRDLRNSFEHKDRRYVMAALEKLAADNMIGARSTGPKSGVVWSWNV